ncbi:hypothetical protein JJQ72_02225 [Paenibacillus sp. F411]|uniref:hypothetical protein n=1 Tax=Paenibacillus sp. F411 TaxID=2820239 RepID=UPI001AAFC40C|nr:hypothetical protein [Paenibacillus sp. F411]MBO2942801.1 hypothetical protein [Paenibacillus sp. F411]
MKDDIESYGVEVSDKLLSIFETMEGFKIRDELAGAKLTNEEAEMLSRHDATLLRRAGEFERFFSENGDPEKIFSDKPPENWWWHIARIASGKVSVDLAQRKVVYEGQTYKY